jgi:hypothetical protein
MTGSNSSKHTQHYEAKILEWEAVLNLPPRRPNRYILGEETGYANHYGGVEMLCSYCRLNPDIMPGFNATWQHGVSLPWLYRKNPVELVYYLKLARDRLVLVANEDQKQCLEAIGYSNVHAVGLPWIYAQPMTKVKRISGSVLVMPPHTLDNAPFEAINQLLDYVDYVVQKYKKNLVSLCACVHMACIRNGQFAQMFLDSGINLITGADHHDRNSLIRMWQVFSHFETVSTPAVGSHVYYALAAGCKVVIEGPKITYSCKQMLLDDTYKRSLDAGIYYSLDPTHLDDEVEFDLMFQRPRANQDMGLTAVGMDAKKTPAQIRRILGWSRRRQLRQMLSMKVKSFKTKVR